MAKKSSLAEDIQKKIEIAEEAVSKVKDEALKSIAFQTVLQRLLALDEFTIPEGKKATESLPSPQEKLKQKAKRPSGQKGRIEELIAEGFFSQKRTIEEIKKELEAHTWHHRLEELSPALIRLVNEKKLRRVKEPEGKSGKLVWRYSKW